MIATNDVFAKIDLRLDGSGPVGVAVSGGGDSVALLHMLARWGRRPLHVFCVDHKLQAQSGDWTDFVGRLAERLGAEFTPLAWQGDKPATGLSAASRRARHDLLADAARAQGIRVLCLGHTRDDVAEAEAMRAAGSNVGSPQTWAPSPAWPQGRGVFLFRPLLGIRRERLRQWLIDVGEAWIDDPANTHPGSLRARVRRTLKGDLPPLAETPPLLTQDEAKSVIDPALADHGMIALRRRVILPGKLPRLLALAAVCAGGGDRLPRSGEVGRLVAGLGPPRTLCGARITADADTIRVTRDAGDMRRRGHEGDLWDGRFEAPRAAVPSWAVRPRPEALRALPADLRDSQPLIPAANPALRQTGYTMAGYGLTGVTCRVLPRFLAAAGVFTRESELG